MSGKASEVDPNHKSGGDDYETAEKNSNESAKGTTTAKAGSTSATCQSRTVACSPLLLQDTTSSCAPSHLLELFKHFDLKSYVEAEILFHLIYLVALESGFAEQHAYIQCFEDLHTNCTISGIFDARNVRCLAKKKPSFSFDNMRRKFHMNLVSIIVENRDRIFGLSSIVTGDLMIVTLTPANNGAVCKTFSICLDIPRYIVNNAWKNPNDHHPLNRSLGELHVLTYNLRQQLFFPAQIEHLVIMDIPLYPALLGLPNELYDYIFHCLSRNQLRIMANVCKRLHDLVVNSKHHHLRAAIVPRRI